MKERKIPMRTCCVSREKLPKKELIRIVRTPENEYKLDLSGKVNGRGVYIKKDIEILKKAKLKKSFDRAFETSISDEIYDELIELGEETII